MAPIPRLSDSDTTSSILVSQTLTIFSGRQMLTRPFMILYFWSISSMGTGVQTYSWRQEFLWLNSLPLSYNHRYIKLGVRNVGNRITGPLKVFGICSLYLYGHPGQVFYKVKEVEVHSCFRHALHPPFYDGVRMIFNHTRQLGLGCCTEGLPIGHLRAPGAGAGTLTGCEYIPQICSRTSLMPLLRV